MDLLRASQGSNGSEEGRERNGKEKDRRRTEQVVEEDRNRNRRIREALVRALCAELA